MRASCWWRLANGGRGEICEGFSFERAAPFPRCPFFFFFLLADCSSSGGSATQITLIGFVFLVVNYLMALLYACIWSSTMPPWWFHLLCVLNMFIYQTMDNLDGKQARRTRTSSVFGEIFDHGCDSLFLAFTIPSWHLSLGSNSWTSLYHLIASAVAFYMAHMEEYYTRVLIMGPIQNPTEAQFFIFLIYILTSAFGSKMWTKPLFTARDEVQLDSLPWNQDKQIARSYTFRHVDLVSAIVTVAVSVATVSNFKRSLSIFWSRRRAKHPRVENNAAFAKSGRSSFNSSTSSPRDRNSKTPSSTVEQPSKFPGRAPADAPLPTLQDHLQHPFLVFMPMLILMGSILFWALWSPTNIFDRHPFYFYAIYSLVSSYLCIKLILARICKTKLRVSALVLVPLLGMASALSLSSSSAPIISEETILYTSLGLTMFIYWHFVTSAFLQFREHYHTKFLTIHTPRKSSRPEPLS
ncbi:uncharacterized CDP-alcohol phosphatidyltransferase class-I family protein 1-like [Schistocerca gregaria]|uniref:uncharacterized CDP-alcohol phosphatidyltransferase class-I family protein 1-like n=1 Tax=Schistocerca gregaria TaxID=7010 RepID=UPI00211F31E6|nr:uncharacterized CDP-alcohol phosphatidyltransferase class-I family protein 1-like [Schistocerca gregaria]